jgi:NAD(P)-dependent dehydrogenase (short-subunit alcohol dehydrogenase family)
VGEARFARPFAGRVALVVGGATGIGKATAIRLAENGADQVFIGDVAPDAADATVALVREAGAECDVFEVDVSDATSVAALVGAVRERSGRIDVAFNNAGVAQVGEPLDRLEEAEWDRVVDIDLKGVWLCLKYEVPAMAELGGAIVNTASMVGLLGFPESAAYVAAKHGVVGLTRTAAVELAPKRIRVNCVCPSIVNTPMFARNTQGDPDAATRVTANYPIPRLCEPEEVADAVCWLASDASSYVNGHALVLDGGESALWH